MNNVDKIYVLEKGTGVEYVIITFSNGTHEIKKRGDDFSSFGVSDIDSFVNEVKTQKGNDKAIYCKIEHVSLRHPDGFVQLKENTTIHILDNIPYIDSGKFCRALADIEGKTIPELITNGMITRNFLKCSEIVITMEGKKYKQVEFTPENSSYSKYTLDNATEINEELEGIAKEMGMSSAFDLVQSSIVKTKKEKVGPIKNIKRAIAGGAALILAGGLAGVILLNRPGNNEMTWEQDKTVVQQEVVETATKVPTFTPEPTVIPTLRPVQTKNPTPFTPEPDIFTPAPTMTPQDTLARDDSIISVIPEANNSSQSMYNGPFEVARNLYYVQLPKSTTRVSISESQYNDMINVFLNSNVQDMTSIGSYIDCGQLITADAQPVQINYSDIFPQETVDYKVVNYFCNKRNTIINHASQGYSRSKILEEVNDFLDEIFGFFYNDKTIDINQNESYYCGHITPFARYIIMDMGCAALSVNNNYSYTINGIEFSHFELGNQINGDTTYLVNAFEEELSNYRNQR